MKGVNTTNTTTPIKYFCEVGNSSRFNIAKASNSVAQ